MVRGSMVAREINLEEKRVHVPTPMVQEPFFLLLAAAAPTVQDTIVTAPVVSSPMATINEHEKLVLQDPIEPVVAHEEEQQNLSRFITPPDPGLYLERPSSFR